ncbi:nuclear pore complex protein Nup50 isoform X1 [Nomia melanderi]|uniref:nuclear pore complex protein Nup50 isoform X1 n=1 Tax=Nomia melanderi TaxID=2448451 RepID=UPI0013046BDE|nr:nuclear pore complex protein Nup50 isoform X1 [Nomia melanderi]
MAAKRSATTELNHDNWNEEHEPEEAGTFIRASDDILEKRVVKRAKRRLQSTENNTKSAFGAFTGFKTTGPSTPQNAFSFLADNKAFGTSLKTDTNINKPPASNGASKGNENGTNKKETSVIQSISSTTTSKTSDQADQGTSKKSSEYFAKLKGLNESVTQWIKSHVDANPFCILTPIFKDYEKYLKEIETKHGNESDKTTRTSEQSQFEPTKVTDNKETANSEKKVDSSPFGGTSTKSLISSEWKPEKSIFGSINTDSKSIFGTSDHATDSGKSVFGNSEQSSDSHKSIFGNVDKLGTKSVFGNVSSEKNPFLSKPSTDSKSQEQESKSELKSTSSSFGTTNAFCFGQSSTTSSTTGFSFGGAKPFTFGAQVVKLPESEDKAENEGKDDEDEEPPKVEIKPVTEEGAIYEQRCKVFIKKDGNFTSRGVGVLFLKPTPNDKTQLIVRAETSLGSLLLNTLLTESIPTKRMNKNSIMLVCLPKPEMSPPPVPVLLRVKTDEEADSLMDALNKHKK